MKSPSNPASKGEKNDLSRKHTQKRYRDNARCTVQWDTHPSKEKRKVQQRMLTCKLVQCYRYSERIKFEPSFLTQQDTRNAVVVQERIDNPCKKGKLLCNSVFASFPLVIATPSTSPASSTHAFYFPLSFTPPFLLLYNPFNLFPPFTTGVPLSH